MRYPAGAGRAGATAVDQPDTPQGGARRMRWLHMSSIILRILCIGMMGSVQWSSLFVNILYADFCLAIAGLFLFHQNLLVDPLLQLRHVGNDTHQTITLC